MPTRTRVAKSFSFDAAHFLSRVPPGHKCARMHGHTYVCEVVICGELDGRGMVADFAEVAEAWAPLHELLDHRTLNDVVGLDNPTAENLAALIFERLSHSLPALFAVRVYESSTTWAEVGR